MLNKKNLMIYAVIGIAVLVTVNIFRGHSFSSNKTTHPETKKSELPKADEKSPDEFAIDQRDKELIQHYTEELKKGTDDASNFYQRALIYQKTKQYNFAIQDFTQAIKITPDSANAYFSRGLTYFAAKQFDDAIADFSKAISLKPDDMHIYNARGLVYAEQANSENALSDLSQALTLDPTYASACFNRGAVYERQQKYKEALADYDCAVNNNKAETENEDPKAVSDRLIEAYYRRAIINLELADLNAAMRDVNYAIEHNPKLAKAFKLRATIYGKQGNTGAAASDEATADNLGLENLMR